MPFPFDDDDSSNKKDEEQGEETPSAALVVADGTAEEEAQQASRSPRMTMIPDIDFSDVHCCDTCSKKTAWAVFSIAVFITLISLLAVSLNRLESTEYGVQYNKRRKQLADAAKTGGLHMGPPGYEFIKFPSTYITVDLLQGTCVSKDGLRVQFSVTFQYQLPQEWILPVIQKYRDYENWADVVEAAGTSAIHHSCSDFEIANFQNQRGVIQSTMEDNLRLKLQGSEQGDGSDGVYALAISLQLRNIELPTQYKQAVSEKQEASEEIEIAKNQRTQETTKARTELLAAQEEARKIKDTADYDVEIVLTEARLKANETVYAFQKEAETIVRVKQSLNLTTEGVLAYMSNQLYARAPHLKVSAAEPAKLSRKEEL